MRHQPSLVNRNWRFFSSASTWLKSTQPILPWRNKLQVSEQRDMSEERDPAPGAKKRQFCTRDLFFNKQIGRKLEPLLHSILLKNYMSVAQAWMALEHLEQVAHLLAFGADWRPWEWRRGAILTYKVGETLAHISYSMCRAQKMRQKSASANLKSVQKLVTHPLVNKKTLQMMFTISRVDCMQHVQNKNKHLNKECSIFDFSACVIFRKNNLGDGNSRVVKLAEKKSILCKSLLLSTKQVDLCI